MAQMATSTEPTPEIMTTDQVARLLQVGRETIYRYIRRGTLDASRLGRRYWIPRRNVELLVLATRTRPHVKLREYTPEQAEEFRAVDALDGPTLESVRRFEEATRGTFLNEESNTIGRTP